MLGTVPFVDEVYEAFAGDGGRPTEWHLRPLTVRQMIDVRGTLDWLGNAGVGPGTRLVKTIQYGLSHWKRFLWPGNPGEGQEVVFAPEMLDCIPVAVRRTIAERIHQISVFDDEFEEELRNAVRTAYLRSEADDPSYWTCRKCLKETRLPVMRNCPMTPEERESELTSEQEKMDASTEDLIRPWDRPYIEEGQDPVHIKTGGHPFEVCPVGKATPRSFEWFKLVLDCEGARMSPSEWMDQPFLFSQAKDIVNQERAELDKARKQKLKKPKKPKKHKPPKRGRGQEPTGRAL